MADNNNISLNSNDSYINIDSYSPELKHRKTASNFSENDWSKLKHQNKKRLKQNMRATKLFRRFWLATVLIISLSFSEFLIIGATDMFAFRRNLQNLKSSVSIPRDVTNEELSTILEQAGIIHSAYYFKLYMDVFSRSSKVIPGEYDLYKNLDYRSIVNALQITAYRTDSFNLTLPEGRNLMEYAEILEEKEVCSKEAFLKECKSDKYDKKYPFLKSLDNSQDRLYKLEGYLFPDTYTFFKNTDPSYVIRCMLDTYTANVLLNEKYFKSSDNEDFNKNQNKTLSGQLSCDQVIIIASIVEAEAANVEDMKIIASILRNRISASEGSAFSHLNSDSTVFYPYRSKNSLPENYNTDHKYNTYNINGLPPGPICNPGINAIDAVINCKKTGYYFFAHDKNKKPYYATNQTQHNINLDIINRVNAS